VPEGDSDLGEDGRTAAAGRPFKMTRSRPSGSESRRGPRLWASSLRVSRPADTIQTSLDGAPRSSSCNGRRGNSYKQPSGRLVQPRSRTQRQPSWRAVSRLRVASGGAPNARELQCQSRRRRPRTWGGGARRPEMALPWQGQCACARGSGPNSESNSGRQQPLLASTSPHARRSTIWQGSGPAAAVPATECE
jgi:hypothetical protein